MPSLSKILTRLAPLWPPPTGLLMPSDFAASKASLNFSADEMSGFVAPFCTASAMAERAMSARMPGTSRPCWVRSSMALVGDDRDVVWLAVGHHLGDPRRGAEGKRKRVAGGALELRRELVERCLHGGGAEHLDLGTARSAHPPLVAVRLSCGANCHTAHRRRPSIRSPGLRRGRCDAVCAHASLRCGPRS